MGAALVAGWLRAGMPPESVCIAEKDPPRIEELARLLPGVTTTTTGAMEAEEGLETGTKAGTGTGTPAADGVVLAVKPADAAHTCAIAARSGARRVLSIMAGVPIRAIDSWIGSEIDESTPVLHRRPGSGPAVLRAMPNTPALVGAGASAVAGGTRASGEDFEWAESLLRAVGVVVRVDEKDLDAVTGLSGSGPAYIFRVVEVLAEAGARAGLPLETCRVLARQTVIGAGKLLEESGEEPETLRAQVTSPGGTTEAGLAVLEANGVAKAFYEAVAAAADRSEELGGAR